MLGMGITLVPADLRRVVRHWPALLVGVGCQFVIMPLAGFLVVSLLQLHDALAVGVILVACCPSGTASNVIAYLAGADVALSVSMTSAGTLLSPLLTPWLLHLYAGALVDVPFADQALMIAKIIVAPVLGGLLLRAVLDASGRRPLLDGLLQVFPAVSILFIVAIVACVVALNADRLASLGGDVATAVVLVNALGLGLGYSFARLLRFDRRTARTVSIEVGMQNSGLGVALASAYFTPTAALPSAFYSLWHNVSGPVLASYWSRSVASGADLDADRD
jgi:bile acid:Na+ symporter, BASS family